MQTQTCTLPTRVSVIVRLISIHGNRLQDLRLYHKARIGETEWNLRPTGIFFQLPKYAVTPINISRGTRAEMGYGPNPIPSWPSGEVRPCVLCVSV